MDSIWTLLIGNTHRAEFRNAPSDLQPLGPVTDVPDIASAARTLAESDTEPGLIVFAQAYPGEFTECDVDTLRRAAPLARMVGLLGRWCEGEARSGTPLTGVIRVYYHQWKPVVHQEIARWLEGKPSSWSLPLTASDEERYLLAAEEPITKRSGRVGIHGDGHDLHRCLADACQMAGYSTVDLRSPSVSPSDELVAVVVDLPSDVCHCEPFIESLRQHVGSAPLLGLFDSPRTCDRERLRRAGVAALVAKPFQLEDLLWQLDQLAENEFSPVVGRSPDRFT